jgi:transcriptional regulator with XRE-family HTH domain
MQDLLQVKIKLGERVRSLREKRGLSQEDLAHETGFGRSFMSAIERGKKDVRISTLVKLATIFKVSLSQLLRGIDEE